MTDWTAAGRKAWETRQLNDAHRVRDLYRGGFSSEAKNVARSRAIRALRAAGGTRCLDLWGGGLSANALREAGFEVISIDDGSMRMDGVSTIQKRRALERTAAEDGYAARWGPVPKFAREADVAFLDFCGPWSKDVARAIAACQQMKAIVVTLMTDHDISTEATSQAVRRVMYEAALRLTYGSHRCRRLCSYTRPGGQPVWVYLLTHDRVELPRLTNAERRRLSPGLREAQNARHRAWGKAHKYWSRLPPEKKAERLAQQRQRKAERMRDDPEYAAHIRKLSAESARRKRAKDPEADRQRQRERRAAQRVNDPTYKPRGPRTTAPLG